MYSIILAPSTENLEGSFTDESTTEKVIELTEKVG